MDWIPDLEWWQWGIYGLIISGVVLVACAFFFKGAHDIDEHDDHRGI